MQSAALQNSAILFAYEVGHQINQRNTTDTDVICSCWYLKYSTETLHVTTLNLKAIPNKSVGNVNIPFNVSGMQLLPH